ncbi:MAG: J domain-containing protein [Roseburia sp.]|nr:J domain-containing protein [Roseburia sp.]MCM1243291.1 J domain-containing protein [Roseburia sp.]
MTIQEACHILGLTPDAGLSEIKKKYRELMMQVHPDMSRHHNHLRVGKCAYTAQEINTAYAVLKEKTAGTSETDIRQTKNQNPKKKQTAKKKTPVTWNAPVNQDAYIEREILQYAEDAGGAVLGHFCIARGKYMWTTDEDFSLFLLSLYQCGRQILDEADNRLGRDDAPAGRPQFQAELTYLLAQQFIAQTTLLEELAKEKNADADGNRIFYMPAMLETSGRARPFKPGENLYPAGVRQHRLYLADRNGQETGYLSFPDDRLYYVVIPLFEQKVVQIKVQTAESQPEPKKKARAAYQNLHLWLKLSDSACAKLPENLNLQIEKVLEEYKFRPR